MSEVIGAGTIKVGVDTSDLKAGVEEGKRSVASLGDTLGTSVQRGGAQAQREIQKTLDSLQRYAAEAGKSQADVTLSRLGNKGASAEQLATAAASLQAAAAAKEKAKADKAAQAAEADRIATADAFIARLKEQAETQDLTSKQLLAYKAAQLGVSDLAAGYISKLNAQGKATAALGEAHRMSGYQAAQLSAQLQDLFVQIEAGGSPVTALIQQGSQLSAVFGGWRGALAGVAAAITPEVVAFGSVAVVATAYFEAIREGEARQKAFGLALAQSGNAAGVSRGQISDMAYSVAGLNGSLGDAADALAQLVASGAVAGAELAKLAGVATEAQRVLGKEVSETVKEFVELGRDPVQASLKLNSQTKFLTAALYDQIAALASHGQRAQAAALAQNALAGAQQRVLDEARGGMGRLETAADAVATAFKKMWAATSREANGPTSLADKLKAAENDLWRARLGQDGPGAEAAAKSRVEALQKAIQLESSAAAAAAAAVAKNDDALRKRSDAYQAAVASAGTAAAAADLARQQAALEAGRSLSDLAYARGEQSLQQHRDWMLQIDMASLADEEANAQRRRELQAGVAPTTEEGRMQQQANLASIDAELAQLRSKRDQLQAEYQADAVKRADANTDFILGLKQETEQRDRQQLAQIAAIGLTGQEADALQRLAQIEDDYLSRRDRLADEARKGLDPSDYSARMAASDAARQADLAREQRRQKALDTVPNTAANTAFAASLRLQTMERERQQAVQLAGLNLSDKERESLARLADAEAEYTSQLEQLAEQLRSKEINAADYAVRLQLIDKFHQDALAREADYQQKLKEQQADGAAGVAAAMKNYLDQNQNAAALAKDAVSKSMSSLEDDLTTSLRNGKLNIKNFADTVIDELLRINVVKPALSWLFDISTNSGIGGLLSQLFGGSGGGAASGIGDSLAPIIEGLIESANGNAWANGARVQAFANGGILGSGGGLMTSPTLFTTNRGLAIGGEAGTEAVMPLARGPGGKLGVIVNGGSQAAPTIYQTYNVGAGVSRPEVMSLMQAYGQQLKGEILSSMRNGGAFAAA